MVSGMKSSVCYFRSSSKMAAITKNSQNYDGLLLCNQLANLDKIALAC